MSNKQRHIDEISRSMKRYIMIIYIQISLIIVSTLMLAIWYSEDQEARWLFLSSITLLLISTGLSISLLRSNQKAMEQIRAIKEADTAGLVPVIPLVSSLMTVSLFASLIVGGLGLTTGTILHFQTKPSKIMADSDYVRYLKNNENSVDDRVRYAISIEKGYEPPNISKCPPEKDMLDFNFKQTDILDLTGLFNVIIKVNQYSSLCSAYDVSNADKVKDCITLVKGKIKKVEP